MNRVGWAFLVMLAAAVAAFALLQSPAARGPAPPPLPAAARIEPAAALTIPVQGVRAEQLVDSWHDPREGGARVHEALDIPAPQGTPVLAAMAGTVEKLFTSAKGGTTAYVRSNDGRWIAYYAHLSAYAPGLAEGQHVGAGQVIGLVGDTGDAGAGNYHLHFALQRMKPGERWWQGEPVNPFPLLGGRAPR